MSSTQNTESDMFKVGNILLVNTQCVNEYAILEILKMIEPKLDYEHDYKCIFICNMVIYRDDREPEILFNHRFHWDDTYTSKLLNIGSIFRDFDLGV